MSGPMDALLIRIRRNPVGGWVLLLSVILTWCKGIQYALLGSFIPILFAGVVTLLLLLSAKSHRGNSRFIRIWAIVLCTWAMIRLLLSAIHFFIKPIPEGHVAAQLGLGGLVLSLVVLFMGIILWRKMPVEHS